MPIQNPVVVVPGITASELRDEYPVKPETVWSAVIDKELERICLHPDDLRYERDAPARVRADRVFPIVYEDLIQELRHNLTDKADRPVPVFPFAYDWRQPLRAIEQQLAGFIAEVIDRTKLLRHYHDAGWDKAAAVDLVGHSMGGLIIAGYLQATGAKAPVGKVATLGAPFQGSFEAPIKVLTGTASLGGSEPNSREREAARVTPAIYHLLPSFSGAVVDPDGKEVDLYLADSWQRGVIETLAEFIRLTSVDPPTNAGARLALARKTLQAILDEAWDHRKRISSFKLSDAKMNASRWLCIVGINSVTRIRLLMQRNKKGEPFYLLGGEDRRDEWTKETMSPLTGDGTVPYLGAKPAFLDVRNLVCVRPDDLGYWEVGDRVLLQAAGFHGTLPNVNLVQRLVIAHLKGASGDSTIWARPAPDIDDVKSWSPPIPKLETQW